MTHLLASTAAASHIQLGTAADHSHPVVVAALPRLCIRLDLYVVNVLIAVRLLPQLLDDLIDVRHLGGVEGQQRLLQGLHHTTHILSVSAMHCDWGVEDCWGGGGGRGGGRPYKPKVLKIYKDAKSN